MPIYDYLCVDCEASFEELVRSARDESEVRCAQCGSARVERQVSTFAMGRSHSAGAGETRASAGCSGGSCSSCSSRCCH